MPNPQSPAPKSRSDTPLIGTGHGLTVTPTQALGLHDYSAPDYPHEEVMLRELERLIDDPEHGTEGIRHLADTIRQGLPGRQTAPSTTRGTSSTNPSTASSTTDDNRNIQQEIEDLGGPD